MAFTQADLDAVDEAIALGALKVKYGDKETEYADINSLIKRRELIQRSLNQGKPTRRFGYYVKD